MTVETFFANFGHLADAPNGVKKLRELILQLAVQGKLVPQDESDEPASILLEKIEIEKARLIKEKIIRKTPLTPIYPENENYELPSSWVWARFGGIAQHNAGKTLDKGRNTGQLRDYITTSNLYWGRFDLFNVKQMPIEDKELERCSARTGDLLIVEGGEAGRAAVWTKDYDVCFQNHVHRARFYCGIDAFYVYRFFEKLNLSGEINQYRKGVGISNMSGKSLASIAIPLPPTKEQKRIVAKVDQLMTLCDELESRQQKQQQERIRLNNATLGALLTTCDPDEFTDRWQHISINFDLLYDHPATIIKLRAAVLQLAVLGKLVPQDSNDEPASVLLERIKSENTDATKKKRGKGGTELAPVPSCGVPYRVPKGWEWTRFTHVASIASNLVKPERYQDSVHVAPNNIEKGNGRLLPCRTVKEDKVRSSNHLFYSGQILYSKIRPNLSKATIVNFGGLCSADMYPINAHIVSNFLLIYILSETFLEMAVKNDTRVAMPKINQEELNKVLVPVPPLDEQKRIVAKVDQLMTLCDELEAKLNQAQQYSGKLTEATVRQLLMT